MLPTEYSIRDEQLHFLTFLNRLNPMQQTEITSAYTSLTESPSQLTELDLLWCAILFILKQPF